MGSGITKLAKHEIISRLTNIAIENSNPDLVQKYSRYFREGYDAFGLKEDFLMELKASLQREYQFDTDSVLDLGHDLINTNKYEFGSLAVMLLIDLSGEFDLHTFHGVKRWFDTGVNNWAHSDYLCSKVTPVFFDKHIINLADLEEWKASGSRWTRRAVPVSMLCLRRKTEPDALLSFLKDMMLEEERVVHQGLGWFLRELWKIYPLPVEDFLLSYKETAARLIFQYATEKMDKEYRARFKKTKTLKGDRS